LPKALKTRLLPVLFGVTLLALLGMMACEGPSPWPPESELHLTPQQARGRLVYQARCLPCHEAYSSSSHRGPSLQGLYKRPEMPSGTPANDERVREVITLGRAKMPAFRNLSPEQLDDLVAFLHTI